MISYAMAKTSYSGEMVRNNKEVILTIPGAVHTDLYDNLDVIPFDKMQIFFEENGVS